MGRTQQPKKQPKQPKPPVSRTTRLGRTKAVDPNKTKRRRL